MEILKQDTLTESVFVKIKTGKHDNLVIARAYRPPSTDNAYMDKMCSLITTVSKFHDSAALWLVDDLNLLDIDWASKSVRGYQYAKTNSARVLEMVDDLGLTQIVDFTTRQRSMLDLFLTNHPSLVTKCKPILGISDHDMIVEVDSRITAPKKHPIQRKIHKVTCLVFGMISRNSKTGSFPHLNQHVQKTICGMKQNSPSTLLSTKHVPI